MAETRIYLRRTADPGYVDFLKKRPLDRRHYDNDLLIDGAATVYKPDGSVLLKYVPPDPGLARLTKMVRPALYRAARPTYRRVTASGGVRPFHSNVVGFYKRRPSAFTLEDRRGYCDLVTLTRHLGRVFAEQLPAHYARLQVAAGFAAGCLIADTAFTTLVANWDAHMKTHRDGGNLPGALGVLVVDQPAWFRGGLLAFPGFDGGVAVRFRPGAVVIADNREYHGNTEFFGSGRASAVAFFHKSNMLPAV